jgi:ComF family protein
MTKAESKKKEIIKRCLSPFLFLINVFFPRICLHCKRDLHYQDENILCPECFAKLEPLPDLLCKRCSLPLPSGGAYCPDCRGKKPKEFKCSFIKSAFVFNPQIRSVVHSFKYESKPYLADRIGVWLSASVEKYPQLKEYTHVLAVPLSRKKEQKRGFNQSKLLAEFLSNKTGMVLLENTIERTKDTKSQVTLSRKERIENMQNAFRVLMPEKVKNKKILLIDDVATTGSTLEECAIVLKKAGAQSVAALTLAREP